MRAIIQRVSSASVKVKDDIVGKIEEGLLVLLGIEDADDKEDIEWLVRKIVNMRIFEDSEDKMNNSLVEVGGEALIVSQFTLHASTRKGNRPSFMKAAHPQKAREIYDKVVYEFEDHMKKNPQTGVFGEMMQVSLINEGPVTIWLDSKNKE